MGIQGEGIPGSSLVTATGPTVKRLPILPVEAIQVFITPLLSDLPRIEERASASSLPLTLPFPLPPSTPPLFFLFSEPVLSYPHRLLLLLFFLPRPSPQPPPRRACTRPHVGPTPSPDRDPIPRSNGERRASTTFSMNPRQGDLSSETGERCFLEARPGKVAPVSRTGQGSPLERPNRRSQPRHRARRPSATRPGKVFSDSETEQGAPSIETGQDVPQQRQKGRRAKCSQ